VHSPFVIGSSIFGILFWDVIYQTKVPKVFLCPYQSLPLDLTSGEFYTNRESQTKTRIAQIKELWSECEMYDHVRKTWSKEEGKKSIVSWKIFQNLDQFECKFIQVKEPNSHLTPSQKTWLLHLNLAGGDAFACCVNRVHSPFVIGSSIFGILFWDVIYQTKVPKVFLCPYQSLPLDLTSGEFYTNRESQTKTRIAQIKELWSECEMYDHVRKTWSKEEGKKSIVSWKIFQN
ncbi:hypothetical protein J437_LFUL008424, partial [Ladona fulva]